MLNRKLFMVGLASTGIAILFIAYTLVSFTPILNFFGVINQTFELHSIHARVTFVKNGEVVFTQYHAGVVTDIGDNMTIYWQSGRSAFQVGSMGYDWNISHIGIGNQGSLSASSTVLPAEWNRTAITTWDNEIQSTINYTAVIVPTGSGLTADCIGLYINATGNYLFGYDTFDEVTGIDQDFTITIEFIVSVTHT